ncbi:hypothetical protein HJC23_003146 [Cyclotella cryptica]|uniref:alkaline phosphatase n=1 Tax=Cyclotella cryptica TaxID=29204 RepID=A0ABD3NHE6_9STRA
MFTQQIPPDNLEQMKFSAIIVHALFAGAGATSTRSGGLGKRRKLGAKGGKTQKPEISGGWNTSPVPIAGIDNSVRLLKREGIIDAIPSSLCENQGKNVILVIGDGMGWEMIRAGAVAKQVVSELKSMGVDISTGASGALAAQAKAAFAGRTLSDYYTEGKGSGLSFQELSEFHVVTTSIPFIGEPNDGNHYGPARSFIGDVGNHENGMGELILGPDGKPLVFDPRDIFKGGNMVLWDDVRGGTHPWDANYFVEMNDYPTDPGFDPEFILQHAIDSANSASSYANGHKTGVNMMGVDLYEQPLRSILQEAMTCDKAGGVMTSVPILHATPAAFITHTNNRNNGHQLQDGYRETKPTFALGTCASRYQPSDDLKQAMEPGGHLSSEFTFLHQDPAVLAEDFFTPLENLDPDDGKKVLACFGGEYSSNGNDNLPYRGLDGGYTERWCSKGIVGKDEDDVAIGVTPNSTICDHWPKEELKNIPKMHENTKAALDFLGKDDDGFFLMIEQGDIDWAAHANHMDDLLGAMFDIDDVVQEVKDWIAANGGYEKNALYVTADHDHYLTLLSHFPEAVANLIIDGKAKDITPENNSNVNAWSAAVGAGRHEDDSQSQTEHLEDFSTWTEEDIQRVAHFFGPRGSGGNGWGSHSSRPVVIYSEGDDGCLEALVGKGYRVLGTEVAGSPGKIDQVHVNACMMKQLFAL